MEAYSYLNLALENFNVFLTGNIRRGLYSFPGPTRKCNVSYGGVLAPSSLNLALKEFLTEEVTGSLLKHAMFCTGHTELSKYLL